MTVVQIAEEVGLSVDPVHAILKKDLGKRCLCKIYSRLLSADQMECRKTIPGDFLTINARSKLFG
jgi:hypothetical protein